MTVWILIIRTKGSEMINLWLGIAAGVFQALGYVFYIHRSLRKDINPNPITWFMFAYGTLFLTILEFVEGATLELLILPATCAFFSVVVALRCWKKGSLRWPTDWQDQYAFFADVVLTVLYLTAFALNKSGLLTLQEVLYASTAFLVCTNLTTLTAFAPLYRGAQQEEHPLPWAVWTIAYILLAVATWYSVGWWSVLMIYPILNALLHGGVVFLSYERK